MPRKKETIYSRCDDAHEIICGILQDASVTDDNTFPYELVRTLTNAAEFMDCARNQASELGLMGEDEL